MAGVAIVSALAALLRRFPPAQYSFYPQCPFHQATGLLCPGCGGTRALAALLHGDLRAAWQLNGLVVLLLPAVFAYFAAVWFRTRRGSLQGTAGAWPVLPSPVTLLLIVACLVFTLVRNLHLA